MAVGDRVADARTESGLTQAQLASAIGLDRSALAKIETGVRRVSAVELVSIARELRRRVEWFVEPSPPAIVSYRLTKDGRETQSIDAELDRIVHDVDFVSGQCPSLMEHRPDELEPPTSMAEAEALATQARSLLDLPPDMPALDLAELVAAIGLMPFSLHLDGDADAGTVLLGAGGVTVINGDLHVGRRRLALAHELGHYLIADPYTTDWRAGAPGAELLEAYLDRFARALLLPRVDLEERWSTWVAAPHESLRDAAVRAGSHYRVDMTTLARRLSELEAIDGSQVESIRNVRTRRADIIEKNLVVPLELEPVALPRVYERAVLSLYRSETISEDRALGLLLDTMEPADLPDLPMRPRNEIWVVTS
ncbi:MAG: helix-turn-helix domain-containing protein [Actinomycetales bacterium]